MTLRQNTAEGGTNTTNVSTGNSGGASGDAFAVVSAGTSNTITYSSTGPSSGSLCYLFTKGGTAASLVELRDATGASASFAGHFDVFLTAYPPNAAQLGSQLRTAADAYTARIFISSTGMLIVANTAGSDVATGTIAIGLNAWKRVEYQFTGLGTSSTTVAVQSYDIAVPGTPIDTISGSGITTTGTADRARFGNMGSVAVGGNYRMDNLAINPGSSAVIGPGSSNVIPTCNAGTDQTNIEAYSTVTVNGTDNDTDGTVVTRTWRVISTTNGAPTPSLVGSGTSRTFEAPGAIAGTVVTLGYKVTDDDGADSTEDTMTVTVLPVTERAVVSNVEVPMKVQVVGS